jgi:ketosteroid isomerase-like protein
MNRRGCSVALAQEKGFCEASPMKSIFVLAGALLLSICAAAQNFSQSDEGAHVLALDNSWNRALETNDTKALDLLLAESFVSIDVDGSMQTKHEFLASLKAPGYQKPALAVTEQSKVDVYGDSAVVYGVFRTQSGHNGKSTKRRERFLDTWVNVNRIWKCVASVAVLIPPE